jgi:hypothetical protein
MIFRALLVPSNFQSATYRQSAWIVRSVRKPRVVDSLVVDSALWSDLQLHMSNIQANIPGPIVDSR